MQTQERNRISNSITNQLQITDTAICNAISDNVNKAVLVNYDSIKLLSKTLKDKLNLFGYEIQHSVVLNVIAKALGYQNHHSMKTYFETDFLKVAPMVFSENDSMLKRFFSIKDEFVNKFNFDRTVVLSYPDKEYVFQFAYYKDSTDEEKLEIKKYLNSYGIKPYKNTITLIKIPHEKLLKIAYQTVKKYRSFFTPIWKESDDGLNNYELANIAWPFLSFADIKIRDAFLMVDSYSTDMPHHVIVDFLNYVFSHGTLKEIEHFEDYVYNEHQSNKYDFLKAQLAARVHEWEKNKELSKIIQNKKSYIKQSLEMTDLTISIMSYMQPFFKKIEQDSNRTLKDIIIDNCDYFYNKKEKYSINEIKEKLYVDLLNKPRIDFVAEILNLDDEDEEIFTNYDTASRCMEKLAQTIYNLIDSYNTVDELPKYAKILKRT